MRNINATKIDKIISACGGDIVLSYEITTHYGKNVSQFALRQWRKRGIPDDYWPYIAQLSGYSVEDIAEACGG